MPSETDRFVHILTVGMQGQLSLPKSLIEDLNLRPDDQVMVYESDGQIVLHPVTQTIFDLRGSVQVDGPQDFAALRQKIHRS